MNTLMKIAQKRRFEQAKIDLEERGVQHYGLHKRIGIPKKELSLKDMESVGFKKSYSGIPEPGQRKFVSYRHPDRYHIHDHEDRWVMHRDLHNPIGKSIKEKYKHFTEEVVPSVVDYVKWEGGNILPGILGD